MSYLEKFSRGERRLTAEELKDYEEAIRIGSRNPEDTKLQNLYRDCFGPHVTDYFGAPKDAIHLSNQEDRLVAADNLTLVFLASHYKVPHVFQSLSNKPGIGTQLSLDEFRARVTTNPIDACNKTNYDLGTNRVTYLIGDVGVGKSTFLSRLVMDMTGDSRRDPDGFRVVPIVYDFEVRHKIGAKLKSIDESFWADLYSFVYQKISEDAELCRIGVPDEIAINPIAPGGGFHRELIHHLKQMIHHLALRKIRLFFIFDNLDRYHFHYTKYSFFDDYAEEQFESVKSNISVLVNMFDKKDLWASGLCVLFVCRRYLYDYLANFDDVSPKDNNFAVYQLPHTSARAVVASRWDLFEAAVKAVDSVARGTKTKEFGEYLRHLKDMMIVKNTAEHHRNSDSPALDALTRIGHNGYRSLVKFLASLSLRYKDADPITRLLVKQPHLLVLLYIANNHQRYSQEQSHFPNLFLVDCVVSPNREFPQAHLPHEHSYWLKYLILKFLAIREQEKDYCTADDIIRTFSGTNRYEEHLVKLVLGSLCTTAEFSCIEIGYSSTNSIADCRLTLTERGRYLVGHDRQLFGGGNPIDFCFSFHYLQLVVDDKLLAFPKNWFNKAFPVLRYGYLYLPDHEYGETASRVVVLKFEAVFHFLKMLEACLEFERRGKEELFDDLRRMNIIPEFRSINHEMILTAERLLTTLNRQSDLQRFIELERQLKYDDSIDEFFLGLLGGNCYVRK